MAFTFGFYNAEPVEETYDRLYDANDFSKYLDGVISDGVIQPYGDAFKVTVTDTTSRIVSLGTGKAWFNGTWNVLDQPMSFTLASSVVNHLEAIILQVNKQTRTNKIYVKAFEDKITVENNPLLDIYEYCLAGIRVTDNAIAYANTHIGEGDPLTPWARCLLPGDIQSGGVGKASAWDKTSEYFNDYENNFAGDENKKEGLKYYATAKGVGTKATGYASFAAGDHTTASGYASTAIGQNSEASGDYSFAGGFGTKAKGRGSIAFGASAEVSENATECAAFVGAKISKSTTNSFAAVNAEITGGTNNFAVGLNTIVESGTENIVLGPRNKIGGVCGVCIGDGNDSGSECITLGRFNNTREGSRVMCVGTGLKSKSSLNSLNNMNALILGCYNDPNQQYYQGGITMMVGNGTSDTDRSNALTVFNDGTIVCKKIRTTDPNCVLNMRFIDHAPTIIDAQSCMPHNALILQYDPDVYVDENGVSVAFDGVHKEMHRITGMFVLREVNT